MILGSNGNGLVNNTRQYLLDILIGLLKNHSVTKQWIQAKTMCYLINLLD